MRPSATVILVLVCACVLSASARAMGNADVAALQVALKARGLYAGTVDGAMGPQTAAAVRRFQQRRGLVADGVPGPNTRRALGHRAPLGLRVLRSGMSGWDVASLQFVLAWRGFPSGNLDGRFGARTDVALRKFQRWAGIRVDGRAGPATVAALRRAAPTSPIALGAPSSAAPTDGFGPRGHRFHTGLDYPAPLGAPVLAAAAGRITHSGLLRGGWGRVVVIDHGQGVRTWYAHLSATLVRVGQAVLAGARIARVGASGRATGSHLHFELRVRGAAVDPLTALA
jgi:murein DD-endopeptidase MepM/ murein hydrolase activator NlpD